MNKFWGGAEAKVDEWACRLPFREQTRLRKEVRWVESDGPVPLFRGVGGRREAIFVLSWSNDPKLRGSVCPRPLFQLQLPYYWKRPEAENWRTVADSLFKARLARWKAAPAIAFDSCRDMGADLTQWHRLRKAWRGHAVKALFCVLEYFTDWGFTNRTSF